MPIRLSLSLFGLLSLVFSAAIASAQEPGVRWHNAADLPLEGRGWTDTKRPYSRLPAKAESLVRRPVWDLAQHSAGFSVRFVTDATSISARWTLLSNRLEMPHMPATGVSGVDLYVRDEGNWKYLGTGRPARFPDNESVLVRGLATGEREYRLYFPLYNGVERLEIGVADGATFKPGPPLRATLRPIVFYGTSITQGGCASRPGMAYPAILGRTLGVPVINLGFSGNGKTEPEMAALLAEINAAAFVLDSLPNLNTAEVSERLPGFIDTIRQRHATVPIVLVESISYPDKPLVASRNERFVGSNDALRRIYNERRAAGDGRIYLVPSHDLIGLDGEGTVDGVHPTDLGFQRMADSLAMHLRLIPRLIPPAAKPEPAEERFQPLFDGESLTGWTRLDTIPAEHVGGKWTVDGGILVGNQDPPGRGGFLATTETFRDFVLRLEVQQDYPTDTGIFVRVGEDGKSHQLTLDYRPQGEMGAIFLPWTQGRVLRNPDGIKSHRPGDWNEVQVRVEGEPARLRMWLNGSLITDFQHTAESTKGVPAQGRIALQVHPDVPNLTTWKQGNTVRYRNIRIHPLNMAARKASSEGCDDSEDAAPHGRLRARELGISIGILPTGVSNAITDVAGVRVGHRSIVRGDQVRTGVTAVLPHGGNLFQSKVPAALHVANGFGKFVGSTQIHELGVLETPIILTNTLSTFAAADALVAWSLKQPGNEDVRSVNPVVGECNDGYLNDIRGRHVTAADVEQAISDARSGPIAEGCVGAGVGTRCLGWKGGIGTSSRKLPRELGGYIVGVLVQTNFDGLLTIAGAPVGQELGRFYLKDAVGGQEHGSCIVVVATDAPLDARQLGRLANRATLGLGAVGSPITHGSGDYVLAFSTHESLRQSFASSKLVEQRSVLRDDRLSPLFQAVREATEEAVVNSLLKATTITGRDGHKVEAIDPNEVVRICRKYGVLK